MKTTVSIYAEDFDL